MKVILNYYKLPIKGFHGIAHWGRVLENGMEIAKTSGASTDVVQYFSVFHDSQRDHENYDEIHGYNGAKLAIVLRNQIKLNTEDFNLLIEACKHHTDKTFHPNTTIQTCWDADRLDLARVGVIPDPKFMGTEYAKQKDTIIWAVNRKGVIPDFIKKNWGIC